ncbi:MAG: NHLP family bacteriocin export ABC transporter permease/ATPase subunit, partial [Clostridiales bacterium]|nr:NHLP family bacteriocin export ABC transporter permease/ATPase subunit [Clostridiales bacterium]
MSLFGEQLKYRQKKDEDNFAASIESIAGAVMGKRLANALDSKEKAHSAIEEILNFYHCKMNTDPLPAAVNTVDEQLEYRMRPFGIMRRNVILDKGWYKNSVGAMLGTLKEDGSAVALIPDKFSGYSFVDFKNGKRVKLNKKTESLLDSEAMCFYKPLPLRSLTAKDLLLYVVQSVSISDIVLFVAMTGVMALVGLLSPMFSKWLFGETLESGSVSALLALAVFMACYTLCRLLLSAFKTLVEAKIETKHSISVHAAVMSRIMSLPASFFKNYSSGELTQRASYVQSICSFLFNSVGNVAVTSLFSLIYVGQIFSFAPALAVPSLMIAMITALLTV